MCHWFNKKTQVFKDRTVCWVASMENITLFCSTNTSQHSHFGLWLHTAVMIQTLLLDFGCALVACFFDFSFSTGNVKSWAVQLACNLSATDQVQLSEKIFGCIRICRDLSRTIIDLGHPSVPTGLVSMVLSATWWALYRSCLLSTWLWKRGFFLTGSSAPNCGETTLSTGVQQSEKTKGLNTDLSKYRWGG